jgi:hypothetical protein
MAAKPIALRGILFHSNHFISAPKRRCLPFLSSIMQKFLVVISLLLATTLSVYAQQPATPTAPSVNPFASTAHADTVRAVHQLFRKRRIGGIVWSAIGGAAAIQVLAASVSSSNSSGTYSSSGNYSRSSNSSNAGGTAVGILVFGGIPAGIGIGKLSRFSSSHERAIIASYEQGQALPHYVKRRLRKFIR